MRRLRHEMNATSGPAPVITLAEKSCPGFHIEETTASPGFSPEHPLGGHPQCRYGYLDLSGANVTHS